MALFSFKKLSFGIQLVLESGVAPLNVLGFQDEKTGVDFRPRTMERLFRSLHAPNIAQFAEQEPDVQSAFRARVYDLAHGRLFISQMKEEESGGPLFDNVGKESKGIGRLRAMLAEQGHVLEKSPRKATFHIVAGDAGPQLAVNGASAMPAMEILRRQGIHVGGFITSSNRELHRVMVGDANVIKIAHALEADESIFVLNHLPEPVLSRAPSIAVSQPYLVSARRGVEVHPVRGNVGDLSEFLPSPDAVEGNLGSFLLRGTVENQKTILARLRESVSDFRYAEKLLTEIPETKPTVAVASDAAPVASARLERTKPITSDSLAKAAAYQLRKSELLAAQVDGVGFILDHSKSLIADETGGGKTLMSAVGAVMRTPPNRKVLVVCPPGIVRQWVEKLDHFIPDADLAGPDTLPANSSPDWLGRLPVAVQRELAPKWERVRRRFVFLPESALESGLEVSRAAIKMPDDKRKTKMAANALAEIKSVLKEPISAVLVDESHEYRTAGPKFAILETIASGRVRDLSEPIDTVVLATATPLHRDAPDLFPILRLMGVKKFQKMDTETFCETYCQRKVTINAAGERAFAVAQAPYGYGMLKEEKTAEITALLSEVMISRTKEELAPTRTRKRIVSTPLPYEPSASLGVSLPGFCQQGNFVPVPAATAVKLSQESNYSSRRQLLAEAKVPATLADVRDFLRSTPPEEKLVVFSQWISVAETISADLASVGVRNHLLTSTSMVTASGRAVATKQELVDDFLQDTESRVSVLTVGAGGTGIDGLHRVARSAIVNDFSVVPGVQVQAEGRVWRIEDEVIPAGASPVKIKYQIANHDADRRDYQALMDRRHELEFMRREGLMTGLDSPETRAVRELECDLFEQSVLALIGEKSETLKHRDNTYLVAKAATEELGERQHARPCPAIAADTVQLKEAVVLTDNIDALRAEQPELSEAEITRALVARAATRLAAPVPMIDAGSLDVSL